ncbi:uncharacterized protein LOC144743359 [Ciona intestinalis]
MDFLGHHVNQAGARPLENKVAAIFYNSSIPQLLKDCRNSQITDPWSGRQQRQLAAISEYTTDFQHVSGKNNRVADALSRALVGNRHAAVIHLDYRKLAKAQLDPEVQAYRTAISNLKLENIAVDATDTKLLCDVSTGKPRPIIPFNWRKSCLTFYMVWPTPL